MSQFWQKVLKSADRVFRALFGKIAPRLRRREALAISRAPARVLVIRPGGAGDAVLLTPSLRMLKDKVKDVRIHFLGENRNVEFARLCYGDVVERFFTYDSASFFHFLVRNIRGYDLVIDTEQFFVLPALVGKLLGKMTIGFSTKQDFLDASVDYFHFSYEAVEFFRLFGLAVELLGGTLAAEEDFRKYLFIRHPLSPEDEVDILVAPFTTKPEKMYPSFGRVLEELSKEFRVRVIGDKKMDVSKIFSVVRSAKLLLCVDNAIVHIGALMGKRSVVIFGPTNHLKWAWRENTNVIRAMLWCSPCAYFAEIPSCPRDHLCMTSVPPDLVISEVRRLIRG